MGTQNHYEEKAVLSHDPAQTKIHPTYLIELERKQQ